MVEADAGRGGAVSGGGGAERPALHCHPPSLAYFSPFSCAAAPTCCPPPDVETALCSQAGECLRPLRGGQVGAGGGEGATVNSDVRSLEEISRSA